MSRPFQRALVCLLGAVLLSLTGAASARADSLDAGKELYHQLDYPSARMELIRAASLSDPHRRAEAYLYLGLINLVEGDEASARQSFRAAVTLDATLQLPSGTSPKVRRVFDDVVSQVARDEQATPQAPAAPRPEATLPPPQPVPIAPAPHSVTVVPVPEAATAAPSNTSASHPSVALPIGFLAAGAAAAAVGVIFGVQESADESAFHSASGIVAAENARSNANTHAVVADVCYAAAAALALTGAAIWISF